MKIKYLFLTMAAALIAGCSEDLDRGGTYNSEKGLIANIPTYSFDNGTRVNISDDLQTFTWSDGDQLGLYYQGSGSTAHAGFTITAGGGSTGNFVNEAFTLKSSSTYYAFYPFNESATIASSPVDFTGQVQNGNGSAAHLGGYNYMYSTVNTDGSGNASIQFKNLGSVMQLQLTVSNEATYTGIDITSDGTKFITKGTASMVDGSVTATETSASIHLDFENGIALNAGDVLTANILVVPVDLEGNILNITLSCKSGSDYYFSIDGKNMIAGKAYKYECENTDEEEIPYITFTSESEQIFSFYKAPSSIEYSVNGSKWNLLNHSTITFGGKNGNLRLRGKSSNGTGEEANISFRNASKVSCNGDIRTLIDYENYATVSTDNAIFSELFSECEQLTSAPNLPATDLAPGCYSMMFEGCTSLLEAPELPATVLTTGCYGSMFYGCTSLKKAPSLPATTLANGCYMGMFYGCTSLVTVPSLPVTTLAASCYASMFQFCESLTYAPSLPATTLADGCYMGMFAGCKSLKKAPELPATMLAEKCYWFMFADCTSLTSAPQLPAMILTKQCYKDMFGGCTNLLNVPDLPATTLAGECYSGMFSSCTSITVAPTLPAMKLYGQCYSNMFNGCTSLTTAPELHATTLASYCYNGMFYGCTSLTKAPELPATTLANKCYNSMFSGCTSLTTAPELPATTLADYCYYNMFQGCTSLVKAPELLALTLTDGCYSYMFKDCRNLNYIKMIATGISGTNYFSKWVEGVSATGTFVKNRVTNWNVTGDSGIPSGWTVVMEYH